MTNRGGIGVLRFKHTTGGWTVLQSWAELQVVSAWQGRFPYSCRPLAFELKNKQKYLIRKHLFNKIFYRLFENNQGFGFFFFVKMKIEINNDHHVFALLFIFINKF